MRECRGRRHGAQGLRTQASETGQTELHAPEPARTNPFELLGCSGRDDGDNSEQMWEHWSGLRKPSCSAGLASKRLCGLEEVNMKSWSLGEERIGEKL